MILSFKEQFVEKIKQGQKATTIRKSGRWTDGRKIHFWKGSPRNPKSNPYHFGMGEVVKVQPCELTFYSDRRRDQFSELKIDSNKRRLFSFTIENYWFSEQSILNEKAQLDGFKDWNELREWFRNTYKNQIDTNGTLYLKDLDLIHFTYEKLK